MISKTELVGLETIQIINRKIKIEKFDNLYFNNLRRELKSKIKGKSDLLLINFISDTPISKRWVVWSLLDLQKEFTEILIMPVNTFSEKELEDYFYHFNPLKVYRQTHSEDRRE